MNRQSSVRRIVSSEPLPDETVDFAIVGAGVVGCALARQLTLDGARVAVIEKALDVLDGASKGNSAILHTGFDAPSDSIELRCVSRGYERYLAEHESLGLPILKSGALVLAWNEQEVDSLDALVEQAQHNGVSDVQQLDVADIKRIEPCLNAKVMGGFHVPREYLIDPWATAHVYLLHALVNGATLHRNHEILSGVFDGTCWNLQTSQGSFSAKQVVCAAGLYGDIVDERLLGMRRFTITPRKGQFVVFEKAASRLVNNILLPVPTSITKGVVVCRTIYGNVLVGPTAEDQASRDDASTNRNTLEQLRAKALKMVPGLTHCEVTATYAGLRPASEFKDYQITRHAYQNYTSVGGIRSTGLSGALGIADYVLELLADESDVAMSPLTSVEKAQADRLSNYHRRDWQESGNQGIVCHCEHVTRREILTVLDGPMPPTTLQGLKRRTRVCMGQCQGFYCSAEIADLTAGRLTEPVCEIRSS